MLDLPGIYMIVCLPTGERYIGGTTRSIHRRFVEHQTALRRGVCRTPRLQAAYDEHGPSAFDYIPLKNFPPEEVAIREKEAIDTLKPALNIALARGKGRYARWDEIEIGGQCYTVTGAARAFGLEPNTIRLRIKRGLTGEALIAQPHKAPRKAYVRRK